MSVLSLTDYFKCFIQNNTELYLAKIRALDHKNYVDPKIEVSEGFIRHLPNPARTFLLDPDLKGDLFNGTLGVLLGEPGQGKTFMTRYLANECAKKNTIPIYVHSEQWHKMQQDEIASLWKTIVHSFRFFEAPIGWIDGAEEDFLRVALRTGLFRIIFDGLDEFILWNKGTVEAVDTIRSLQELSDATGTRILVSSRTSFWESEVVDSEAQINERARHIFKIMPFDENNAIKYFNQRFSKDAVKAQSSIQLFRALREKVKGNSTDFVGRGFFLSLIADLVDRDYTLAAFQLNGRTVFSWMVEALCEREQKRQKLPMSASEQVAAFREFAEFIVKGDPPSPEILALVIQGAANLSDTDANALASSTGKLKDHPLIRYDTKRGWAFVQEQIWFNLLAEQLTALSATSINARALEAFAGATRFDLQLQADVASAVVEQLFEKFPEEKAVDQTKTVIKALLGCSTAPKTDHATGNLASLATMTALTTTSRLLGQGKSHRDRAEFLMALFPSSKFEHLYFSGSLARFDFSDVEFVDCVFDQVSWANCTLSEGSSFNHCRFNGGLIAACSGFGLASFMNSCLFDATAKHAIGAETVRSGKRQYSADDLKIDIAHVVTKFIPKDGLGVKTVEDKSLSRGPISMSIHKDKIINAFKRQLVEPHILTGSGGGTGYHVVESARASFSYFSTNGVFTGPLADMFEELKAKLLS